MFSRRHFQSGGKPRLEGRKTKFWRGWYWQYFENGTRKRKSVFVGYRIDFPTRRAATRKLNEIVCKMNDPRLSLRSTTTLAELFQEYQELAFPVLKRSTQYDMKVMLNKHVLPALGSLPIDRINRDVLQGQFNLLFKRRVAWTTARKVKAYLSSVFSRAIEDERLGINPVALVKLPQRPPAQRKKLMNEADILRIEAALADERNRTLWWLTYQTGLRIGESSALRWRSIDWKTGALLVRESVRNFQLGTPKTEKSGRALFLSECQLQRLREYHRLSPNAREDDFLFPNKKGTGPIGYTNIMKRNIRPVAKKLGIAVVGWHSLRHLCSTIMDEEQVPAGVRRDHLGHTTLNTTMIYTHARAEEHRRASDAVFQHFSRVEQQLRAEKNSLVPGMSSPVLGTTLGTTSGAVLTQLIENASSGPIAQPVRAADS